MKDNPDEPSAATAAAGAGQVSSPAKADEEKNKTNAATSLSEEAVSENPQTKTTTTTTAAAATMPLSTTTTNTTKKALRLAVFFSTGDLGDVGRHVVTAALERTAQEIQSITVFCKNTHHMLLQAKWKCVCPDHKLPKQEVVAASATTSKSLSSPTSSEASANTTRKSTSAANSKTKTKMDLPDDRLTLVDFDVTKDDITMQQLQHADVMIACFGNRKPFHPDCIARVGTSRIVQAIMQQLQQQNQQQQPSSSTSSSSSLPRFILLSSAGIANDWPPMEWCQEGQRLESLFRTICWSQYQDLKGAEQAVMRAAAAAAAASTAGVKEAEEPKKASSAASKQQKDTDDHRNVQQQQQKQQQQFDYLIVRAVLLEETCKPVGRWKVQRHKYTDEHPHQEMSKLDCARYLVQEALHPVWHNCAVLVGGCSRQKASGTDDTAVVTATALKPKPASIAGKDHDKKVAPSATTLP